MKKRLFVLLIFIMTSCYTSFEVSYQHDKDIIRLNHLKYWGKIIEEYHSETGRYPLQEDVNLPNYVFIANEWQRKRIRKAVPYSHKITDMKEFIEVLEVGIGRKFDIKYDHQKISVTKPNYYIYSIHRNQYFFAVHLYNSFSFARKVADNYYKLEISNIPNLSKKIWIYSELMKNKDFIIASAKELYR